MNPTNGDCTRRRKTAANRYELLDDEGVIRTEGKFNMLGGEISKYIDAGFAEVNPTPTITLLI
jgi:hypothetical protein